MSRKYKAKTRRQKEHEEELMKRLKFSIMGIFAFIIGVLLLFNFFGPKIGALFGFISIHRNETGPTVQVTLSPPIFNNLPKATNQKTITIEGFAKSGTTVILYLNGPEKGETLTDGEGKFVFENIQLMDGRNTLFAKLVDGNGNKSENSETEVITVDDKKPDITINEPKDGETIKNLNKRILIKGSVSEKSKITINNRLVVLKPDLTFEFLLGVDEGDVQVKVKATDEAGNSKTEIVNVKYKKDSD